MTLEEWDRTLKGMSRAEYAAERRRLARRERLRTAGEIAGGVFAVALFALLAWLFLAATPDQASAECEALRCTNGRPVVDARTGLLEEGGEA